MKQILKYILLLTALIFSALSGYASGNPGTNKLYALNSISSNIILDKAQKEGLAQTSTENQKATRRQQLRVGNFSFNTACKRTSSSRQNHRLMQLAKTTHQQNHTAAQKVNKQLCIRRADRFHLHNLCKLVI